MTPSKLSSLLKKFVKQSKKILREGLVGVYLHGSAVMGCFNPEKSDIDLIIVVSRPLPDSIKREFLDMVMKYNALAPAKGIEMSIVLKDVCNPFVYPTPFELHFSVAHLKQCKDDPEEYIRKMNNNDTDLAAHFTVLNKRGVCLCGAPIKSIFAEVPSCNYMDSIWRDVADAPKNIEKDTVYMVLNLARVLAYKEEGLVLSKKEGGEWAIKHLPTKYHQLVKDSLCEYSEDIKITHNKTLAKHYAKYIIKRIQPSKISYLNG